MNDKIKINLQMAGAAYPLTINREDEEMVREAAKQVDIRLKCVSGALSECVSRENYSHGGLSVRFRKPSVEGP